MEGSGTGTIEAGVILLGAELLMVAQALPRSRPSWRGLGPPATFLASSLVPSFLAGGSEDHLSRLPRHVNRTCLVTRLSLSRATENYFYIIGFFSPWYISREFLSELPEPGGGSLLNFPVAGFPWALHHHCPEC